MLFYSPVPYFYSPVPPYFIFTGTIFYSPVPYFYSPVPPYFIFTGTIFFIHRYHIFIHRYRLILFSPVPFFIHLDRSYLIYRSSVNYRFRIIYWSCFFRIRSHRLHRSHCIVHHGTDSVSSTGPIY